MIQLSSTDTRNKLDVEDNRHHMDDKPVSNNINTQSQAAAKQTWEHTKMTNGEKKGREATLVQPTNKKKEGKNQ